MVAFVGLAHTKAVKAAYHTINKLLYNTQMTTGDIRTHTSLPICVTACELAAHK